jgi:predicted HNH restriction endonuclease
MSERIFEEDLKLPALYLISLKNGEISTTELSDLLRKILQPKDDDLKIHKGRKDDFFSQIVRNLTGSKRPFVQEGFIKRDSKRNSSFFITDKGKQCLSEHKFEMDYLLTNGFKPNDIKENLKKIREGEKLQFIDENSTITEGLKGVTEKSVYERSKKLRDFAIKHYTINEKINCHCCGFDFQDFYGKTIGKNFIELHHIKPISKYEDKDFKSTIKQAVVNLIPVCSNCHRMIHRNWSKSLEIEELINQINANGVFEKKN